MEKQADSQSNSKVRLLRQVAEAVLKRKEDLQYPVQWVGRVLAEEHHRVLSAPRPDQTNR